MASSADGAVRLRRAALIVRCRPLAEGHPPRLGALRPARSPPEHVRICPRLRRAPERVGSAHVRYPLFRFFLPSISTPDAPGTMRPFDVKGTQRGNDLQPPRGAGAAPPGCRVPP